MKKLRVLTALLSAATAISALSFTASAGYIKDDNTPCYDISPSVKGEIRRVSEQTGEYTASVSYYYYDENDNIVKNKGLLYIDYSSPDEIGYNMRMVNVEKSTGKLKGDYTGFTSSSDGRRYYDSGRRVYGWYKVGKSWYHFDKNGYADTGRVKICGSYYTFDEKGKWTGKVSKKGLAPDDFSLSFSNGLSSFNTDGYIYYGSDWDDNKYEKTVKLSARDRQAIYCMFLESGFSENEEYNYEYLSDKISEYTKDCENDALLFSESTPTIIKSAEITCGEKSFKISFSDDCEQITHFDESSFRAFTLVENLSDYRTKYLYTKHPKPKADYIMLD